MAEARKWLRHSGNSSDSLAKDTPYPVPAQRLLMSCASRAEDLQALTRDASSPARGPIQGPVAVSTGAQEMLLYRSIERNRIAQSVPLTRCLRMT